MKLFQYWNADPPADVAAMMEAARVGQPDFDYLRFDEASARAFVAREHGARRLAAWDALALPAMQADLLRLLLLDSFGGVYVDATYEFLCPLSAIVGDVSQAQLPAVVALVNSNYVMVRKPGNAFVRACVDVLIDNVEARRCGSALMASGPGVLNAVRCVLLAEERPAIAAMAGSIPEWMEWGWAECLAAADRVVAPDAAAVAACRAIDLLFLRDFQEKAISRSALHRSGGRHWRDRIGRIYQ